MASAYRSILSLLMLACAAAPLRADEPGRIDDEAKLFKSETIDRAKECARDLAKKNIRLVVETHKTVPKDMIEKVKAMDADQREEYFEKLAQRLLKKLGPNTLHILLTADPKHLQVTVGAETEKKGFSAKDRKALTQAMIEKLRKGQMDDALLGALATIRKRFDVPVEDADRDGGALPRPGNRAALTDVRREWVKSVAPASRYLR